MDPIDKFLKLYSYKFPKGYPDMNDKQDILLLESMLKEDFNIVAEGTIGAGGWKNGKKPDKGPFAKQITRIQILADKIKKGEVIVVQNKDTIENIKVDPNKEDEIRKWDGVGKIDLGNGYSTSNVVKTNEFGGTENTTAKSEAAQAIALAIRLNNKNKISEKDFTLKNIENAISSGRSSIKIIDKLTTSEALVDWFTRPDKEKSKTQAEWRNSTIATANELVDKILGSGDWYIFWQDEFVEKIYEIFNKVKKLDNQGEIVSGLQGDKWNPADIFVATPEGYSILRSKLDDPNISLPELNDIINYLFCNEWVYGISLKKSPKSSPEIKQFNNNMCKDLKDKEGDIIKSGNLGDIEFKGYDIGGGGTITIKVAPKDDKDNKIEIDLRNFQENGGFSGEIKGKSAAGGKIGLGPIEKYLNKPEFQMKGLEKKISLPDNKKAKNLLLDPTDPDFKTTLNHFRELYEKHVDKEGFDNFIKNKPPKNWTSKYMGLNVIDAIDNSSDKTKLIYSLLQYAGSQIPDVSSAFIKSGN